MTDWVKKLLREPLVHFLGAGLAIFFALGWSGGMVDPGSKTITINEAKVAQIAAGFAGVWRRQPTPGEIDNLIHDYVREEIYYREAKRLGLDDNDPIIRRRLRAKMEELATAAAQSARPSDTALQAMLDTNQAKYAEGSRTSFTQIWLGADGDATAALRQIEQGTDAEILAKPISLPKAMRAADAVTIDRAFGEGFTARLAGLPQGKWAGPVMSGFGVHLVRVENRKAGQVPRLNQIRQRLENDWRAANVSKRKEAAYQALLDGYKIEIEKPR
ncbi:MAG: peptidylprolyl isomerase [Sphingorhabdus sp.]